MPDHDCAAALAAIRLPYASTSWLSWSSVPPTAAVATSGTEADADAEADAPVARADAPDAAAVRTAETPEPERARVALAGRSEVSLTEALPTRIGIDDDAKTDEASVVGGGVVVVGG